MTSHTPPPPAGDDLVHIACKAYAEATGYYVPYHRGLSSESADKMREGMRAVIEALTSQQHTEPVADSDDAAVDRFAAAMKAKLKWEREERGRSGWDNPAVCSEEYLARLLVEHLDKGNEGTFEDVANFAMMLHQRNADPLVLAEAIAKRAGG